MCLVGLVGPRPLPDEAAPSPLSGGLPGVVNHSSSKAEKVTSFRNLFVGRDYVHAQRWESDRTGRAGWMPVVEDGLRRGQTDWMYSPLTDGVVTAYLAGTIYAGLYPLMNGCTCRLLVCDFDEPMAPPHALANTKAARSFDVPTALEVSRSGPGAHVWMFFADAVAATTARTPRSSSSQRSQCRG
ncbi:MAG: TOTE conflict system archaeo-eukaryotic primase domain-containing protein [Acidimicrobiales bacterium]